MRLSEWIVELTTRVTEDTHARGSRDGCCDAQIKNERLHVVIRKDTARAYARSLPQPKRRSYYHINDVGRCSLSIVESVSPHKSSLSLNAFWQEQFCTRQPGSYFLCQLRLGRLEIMTLRRAPCSY